jgi:hypothetical protein
MVDEAVYAFLAINQSLRYSSNVVRTTRWPAREVTLAVGDRIRFTKNFKHRGHKFLSNELRTVVSIDEGKIIFYKGEIVRTGAALHLDQGITVTSHASQAKTVDQVIASVAIRSFTQAKFSR